MKGFSFDKSASTIISMISRHLLAPFQTTSRADIVGDKHHVLRGKLPIDRFDSITSSSYLLPSELTVLDCLLTFLFPLLPCGLISLSICPGSHSSPSSLGIIVRGHATVAYPGPWPPQGAPQLPRPLSACAEAAGSPCPPWIHQLVNHFPYAVPIRSL